MKQFWNNRKERKGIWPLIAAAVAGIGSLVQNNQNKQMVRDQMAFQERMSSTAAQRSVEDYRRAGLNPALAYERTASSPGGASATMEDAIGKGVSTALAAKALKQNMELAKQQTTADIKLKSAQESQALTQASYTFMQDRLARQAFAFQETQQPFTLRAAAAQALASEWIAKQEGLKIPGMENTANWERTLKTAGPVIGTARTLSEIIKSLGGVIRR